MAMRRRIWCHAVPQAAESPGTDVAQGLALFRGNAAAALTVPPL